MRFIKEALTKNLLLKILSLLFAVFIWLIVVNVSNPQQSRNFTTNVVVENENVLSEQGKYYTIPFGQNTVTFKVTAPRSIIENLSSDDFSAVADLRDLEDDVRIPINITPLKHVNSVTISNRLLYLTVEVGDEMEEKYVISAQTQNEPASGFIVDTAKVEPNIITVKGPEPIVSQIDSVVAYCDVQGMNEPVFENVVPTLLDREGKRIDSTKLTLSLSTVDVSVLFTNVKEVPIELEGMDFDNNNVEITDINIDPETVMIKGDSAILNDITEIKIPTSVIDLESVTGDVSTTVDISRYLPEGATLTDDTEPEVKVDIKTSSEKTKTVRMPAKNISVRNLEGNKGYTITVDAVDVSVTGLPSVIDKIRPRDLTGHVNASGLNKGKHTVRVEMDEVENVTFGTVTVEITVTNGD